MIDFAHKFIFFGGKETQAKYSTTMEAKRNTHTYLRQDDHYSIHRERSGGWVRERKETEFLIVLQMSELQL